MRTFKQNHKAFLLIGLMIFSVYSPVFSASKTQYDSPIQPTNPATGNHNGSFFSDNLTIAKNHSIDSAEFHISPSFQYEQSNGTYFNSDWGNSFATGMSNQTSYLSYSGDLTLQTNSSVGSLTDFETSIPQAVNWFSTGKDNSVWKIENLSQNNTLTNLVGTGFDLPSNASDQSHILSTNAFGALSSDSASCLATPTQTLEMTAFDLTLTFDHWLSLADDDISWLEYRIESGNWQPLPVSQGYPHQVDSSLYQASNLPIAAWNGSMSDWDGVDVNLSSVLNPVTDRFYDFRYCFATSNSNVARAGLFIDNLSIYDAGTQNGVWFHGNLTGDYSPNAEGWLIFPLNLSSYNNNSRLFLETNWDIEGGNNDQMTTWLSLDNGSNWILLSPYPGHPGFGVSHNGLTYMQESFQWIPIQYSIPPNAFNHNNSSSALLAFFVQTDNIKHHGGNAGTGWEGMMIDDVGIIEDFGLTSEERHVLMEFNQTPSYQNGSKTGWLQNISGLANDWQYIRSQNAHPENWINESFESQTEGPPGWTVQTLSGSEWSIGTTSNTSGWGPGYWPSGNNGAGIVLNGKYAANSWTHLISPTYVIPENSTARVSFKSWVCTEPNWDGGAVSISQDDGENWWFIPLDAPNFHDVRSTANVYSPLFGEGIFDGSQVPNGCLYPHQFASKSTDVSNLSGEEIRVRFSFFSDTYVESHGWYVDDAGVEVDVFETLGSWTSPPIYPNPTFDYGVFDAQLSLPNSTSINFTLLDQNGSKISDLSLGQSIDLDIEKYPSVSVKADFYTEDWLVTPRIETIGLGSNVYLTPSHLIHAQQNSSTIWDFTQTNLGSYGELKGVSSVAMPLTLDSNPCLNEGFSVKGYGTIANSVINIARSSGITTQINSNSGFNISYVQPSFDPDYPPSIYLDSSNALTGLEVEFNCIADSTQMILTQFGGHELLNTSGYSPTIVHRFDLSHNSLNLTQVSNASVSQLSGNFELSFTTFIDSTFDSYSFNQNQLSISDERLISFNIESDQGSVINLNSSISENQIFGTQKISQHFAAANCTEIEQINVQIKLAECILDLEIQATNSFKIYDFIAIGLHEEFTIYPDLDILNSVFESNSAQSDSNSSFVEIEILSNGQNIGHSLGWNITSSPKMNLEITQIPTQTWLPETNVRVMATASREIPYDSTNTAPSLVSAQISLSPSPNISDSLVTIEFVDLDTSPRIRQIQGAGLAQFDNSLSSISCQITTCDFDLILNSTWLLDDIEQAYWFFSAWDEDQLNAGPVMDTHISISKSVLNDVEIFNFQAFDDFGNNLGDSSQPYYPIFMKPSANISVSASVRFAGVNSGYLQSDQATVGVDIYRESDLLNPISTLQTATDSTGQITAIVSVPQGLQPGEEFIIVPSIIRCSNAMLDPSSCGDQTNEDVKVVLRYDAVQPMVNSLQILDSGYEYPADGHIMMEGQNIALRANISDDQALAGAIRVWTWLEAVDDLDLDGEIDVDEYNYQTLQLEAGAKNQTIDLPLIPSSDVLPSFANQGRASIAITGMDYARNPFSNSGELGNESLDLATIYVQKRAPTTIANEYFSLNRENGTLLPGSTHTFSMQLTDGNGLKSLDSIELMLMGRDNPNDCNIHYNIPLNEYIFDASCFLYAPRFRSQQVGITQTFEINFDFELTWEKAELIADFEFTPGLIIEDEGQDLGLGVTQLSGLSWSTQIESELRMTRFQDTVSPYGQEYEGTIYVSKDDLLRFEFDVFYKGTEVTAKNLPHNISLNWRSNDGFTTVNGSTDVNNFGRSTIRMPLETQQWIRNSGMLYFESNSWAALQISPISYSLIIDDNVPRLVIPPGEFTEVRSDELENFRFNISVQDAELVRQEPITMNWHWTRAGMIIDSSGDNSYAVPLVDSRAGLWSGEVNLDPSGFGFRDGDHITIWFDAFDMSGKRVQGIGSMEMPLNLDYNIISFEPVLTSVIANPYRPSFGEEVNVTVELQNQGVLPGEVNLTLRDQQGNIYGTFDESLEPNQIVIFTWTIEVFKSGELGLEVHFEGTNQSVPVVIAKVPDNQTDSSGENIAITGSIILAIILALMVVLVVRIQRKDNLINHFEQKEFNLRKIENSAEQE